MQNLDLEEFSECPTTYLAFRRFSLPRSNISRTAERSVMLARFTVKSLLSTHLILGASPSWWLRKARMNRCQMDAVAFSPLLAGVSFKVSCYALWE